MTRIILIFLLFFLVENSFAQDTEFNWKDNDLVDKVKKITETRFTYEDSIKTLETTWIYFYDKIGLGVKSITIHHNDENQKIMYSAYNWGKELYGTYVDSSVYSYDEKNRLIKKQEYDPTGVTANYYYRYFKNHTINQCVACNNGDCDIYSLYISSNNNSTKENLNFNIDGSLNDFSYFIRTDNDSVFEQLYSDNSSESQYIRKNKKMKVGYTTDYLDADTLIPDRYYINHYDDSLKHIVKQEIYSSDKKTLLGENSYTYKYKDGKLIEEKTINEKGQATSISTYSHSETSSKELNDDGTYNESKSVYEFDSHGNWILEKYYFDGEIYSETYRNIVYYKENDEDGYRCFYADSMLSSSYKNRPKEVLDSSLVIKQGQLQLLVKFNDYSTVHIYLINKSDTSVTYTSQDGYIPMIREARDSNGEWQPIEFWEWSFCGNSYHSRILATGEVKTMSTFIYGGEIKTKVRFKMLLKNYILYSDSYDGWINKNQFIRQKNKSERDFLNLDN